MPTAIGSLPIGFRQLWGGWTHDLDRVLPFARENGFASLDITQPLPRAQLQRIVDAGVRIGTVDPVGAWSDLAALDAGKRAAAAQRTAQWIGSLAPLATMVFSVAVVEDDKRSRAENFTAVVDGYGKLCELIAPHGAKVLIEGWPGGEPHYGSIGCTPADYRALLAALPSNAGINFDPSHLVRMGIDPVRFVDEFASRIHHVHGKDTELLPEALYEHGNLQPATFAKPRGWGGFHWRYCVPGHGSAPWTEILRRLAANGYRGLVSIELEDEDFNGSEEGEKRGFLAAQRALATFGATRTAHG